MTHENQVLTRKQLIERLWDVDEAFVDDNTLSVYIKRLRDKLEEDAKLYSDRQRNRICIFFRRRFVTREE